MIRYQILQGFPEDLIKSVKESFFNKFPDIKSLEDIPLSNHENSILRYIAFNTSIPSDIFTDKMLCMLSFPNCGRGQVHVDQGRNFCVNIPLQVDPIKGPFVAIKNGIYGNKVKPGEVNYEYIPEYYENVSVTSPILVNTSIPHAFINNSGSWRIMVSLFPKANTIEEANELLKQWV